MTSVCEQCGASFRPRRPSKPQRFCSRSCAPSGPKPEDTMTRLRRSFCVADDGCWVWQGRIDHNGYGRAYYCGKTGCLAHRVIYELLVGPVPAGLTLDHLCRNRGCVNPSHLEPVTNQENVRRGVRTRLRPDDVRRVRAAGSVELPTLATSLGVSVGHLRNLRAPSGRRLWSEVAA